MERAFNMRCINLRKATHESGGLNFQKARATPGLIPIQLECRKCLPCRIKQSREKAIRAVHESGYHEDNYFLTLTYKDPAPKNLIYQHWQNFMKRLRISVERNLNKNNPISFMVTGEYGDQTKRPHWHAILFNLHIPDLRYLRANERKDRIFKSQFIDDLWGYNDPKIRPNELGSVTMDSASYVARYNAKKLVHGFDGHGFEPIHKTSSKHPIGRAYIEEHYLQIFGNGYVTLPGGQRAAIPRYYKDWCKEHHPEIFSHYQRHIMPKTQAQAEEKERQEELQYFSDIMNRAPGSKFYLPRKTIELICLEQKFKQLKGKL